MNHQSEVIFMRMTAGIVVFAIGVAAGCNGSLAFGPPAIAGSGVLKEETRAVDAFHAVEAGNAVQVNVTITAGAKPSLKISGDDNLLPLFESLVRDGKLIIRLKENSSISTKLPVRAEVVVGEIDGVEATGAANLKVKGAVKASRFTAGASGAAQVSVHGLESSQAVVSATGAAQVTLSGTAASLNVDAAGASQVKAQSFTVEDAHVAINGASRVTLTAKKSVTGDALGASQLELHGNPPKKTVSTSGASRVVEE